MLDDVLMFDNFALFAQFFFSVAIIAKFLCESDSVIYKEYDHCVLSLTYNSEI